MKVWYDTEFWERGPSRPIQLISIGMVREDGEELYLINADFDYDVIYNGYEWLRDNVLKHLPGGVDFSGIWEIDRNDDRVVPFAQIGAKVSAFLEVPNLELWAWYGAYDHVVLAQSFGTMMNLPTHVPMFTMDVRQEMHRLGNPRYHVSAPEGAAHDALFDARVLRERHLWLMRKEAERELAGSVSDL